MFLAIVQLGNLGRAYLLLLHEELLKLERWMLRKCKVTPTVPLKAYTALAAKSGLSGQLRLMKHGADGRWLVNRCKVIEVFKITHPIRSFHEKGRCHLTCCPTVKLALISGAYGCVQDVTKC